MSFRGGWSQAQDFKISFLCAENPGTHKKKGATLEPAAYSRESRDSRVSRAQETRDKRAKLDMNERAARESGSNPSGIVLRLRPIANRSAVQV